MSNVSHRAVAVAVVAASGFGAVLGLGPAGAQTASECTGDTVADFAPLDRWEAVVRSWHEDQRTRTLTIDIPAGTYDVNTAGRDGYPERVGITQPNEQYHLEFLDADGVVIAESGSTTDLADLVESASWSGPVGTVELDRPAVAVRAQHSFPGDESTSSANSVEPVCVGLTLQVPPTTTTEAPPSTTVAVTTTSTASSSTTAPTPTTSVPGTAVQGVTESAPATPTVATPQFTG